MPSRANTPTNTTMTSKSLPIAGYPYLALAAQADAAAYDKTLAGLRAQGFTIEQDRIVPPKEADGRDIIAAITAAFQNAKVA